MSQTITEQVHWTSADVELLPQNGTRYEIIGGDLYMTTQPHWDHQETCVIIASVLHAWTRASGLGRVSISPGVLFAEDSNVAPDVVWMSHARLATLKDDAGHVTGVPELVVEVLSPGATNRQRDRETKRKLYSVQGAQEYWIVDWEARQVEVYRRSNAELRLVATLFAEDTLHSPLLPGFSCLVGALFP